MKTHRLARIEEQVKRIIGEILSAGAKDPRIGLASVTRVSVSPDLQQAKVFISAYGSEEEKRKTFAGLQSARSYIQRELGSQVSYRNTPVISFHEDLVLAYGARIDEILLEIKKKEGESSYPPSSTLHPPEKP
jgi:ribosome-binding factor A